MACAPTGSGKTALFELAIIRLLMQNSEPWNGVKAVYSEYNNDCTLRKQVDLKRRKESHDLCLCVLPSGPYQSTLQSVL